MDPNLIAITETQINPVLLDSSFNIPELLFQSDLYVARLSNNSRELIGKHQQGGVLFVVRGDLCSLATASDSDNSSLGRWNSIDICNENIKLRMITTYRYVRSKQTENIVYMQQLCYFRRIGQNLYPIKAFAINLT